MENPATVPRTRYCAHRRWGGGVPERFSDKVDTIDLGLYSTPEKAPETVSTPHGQVFFWTVSRTKATKREAAALIAPEKSASPLSVRPPFDVCRG